MAMAYKFYPIACVGSSLLKPHQRQYPAARQIHLYSNWQLAHKAQTDSYLAADRTTDSYPAADEARPRQTDSYPAADKARPRQTDSYPAADEARQGQTDSYPAADKARPICKLYRLAATQQSTKITDPKDKY